eukprot:TRINITY_DN50655_c0_g1_i1.p1 TRINITY_DN50655_c0_g1~~TRINITY_DN50655_c0_g1_i1.p1  ORF type:complete len:230 (+),score=28.65 TRINITY_DN50655_c0_g1_i1:64-690(+)
MVLATSGIAVCGAVAHVAFAIRRYGLQDAWNKSLARKGSFTAPLDPRRLLAGLIHFWAIWGEARERLNGRYSEAQRREAMADWHGWYYRVTGEVNRDMELKARIRALHSIDESAADIAAARAPKAIDLPLISMGELRHHASRDSCWLAIGGLVYDMTTWLAEHPGGAKLLLEQAGGDATQAFRKLAHSEFALKKARTLMVGRLDADSR